MRRCICFALCVALSAGATASWYWPFGSDDEERPPRLSELMEPASLLIDEATDLASEGKVQESVEKYRKALVELDKVEAENPKRAETPEFATLRNKRAYVNAAIDSLLMSQVKDNARAVAVCDTTALEKKLRAERAGIKLDENGKIVDPSEESSGTNETASATGDAPAKAVEPPAAPVEATPKTVSPVADGRQPTTKRERIIHAISRGDAETASKLIDEMLSEKPNNALALNLRAALESRQGKLREAEATLDQAIMSNPRSPHAYYNMAYLLLQRDPSNTSSARRYYETGRAMGGAPDANLEEAFK